MKTVKWDRVKQKALDIVYGAMHPDTKYQTGGIFFNPLNNQLPYFALEDAVRECRPVEDVILEYMQSVMDIIRNWDVRKAQALIDLFAEKKLRIGPRKIEGVDYSDDGEWILIYD